jgi:signal transduction histidine kinase
VFLKYTNLKNNYRNLYYRNHGYDNAGYFCFLKIPTLLQRLLHENTKTPKYQNTIKKMRFKQILATVIIGFLALTTYFLVWSYHHAIDQAQQASLMRLMGITNALALQIDGDEHTNLMKKHPKKDDIVFKYQDSTYLKIHTMLAKNKEANMLKTPVYTIIFDSTDLHYEFGVTSSDKPYFRHAYTSYPQTMMDKSQEGAMIPMYEDEFGMWLSAFSVIKNKSGKVVALVQADEEFMAFIKITRKDVIRNLLISFGVFALFLVALLRVLQPILKREQRDKEALAAANIQITQLDNFRKEMIANVSHDLRTPMASIMGFAETLLQKSDTLTHEDRQKYLQIIAKEAKRMNAMIAELFDLSKLEAGQIILHKEPFNLSEMAQDTLYTYTEQTQSRQIRLLTEFQAVLPLIEADVFWINRVLQNLLSNAIKYVNDGGLIKITIFTEADFIHFKVCNTGKVIEKAHLEHIFDRFFKSTNHHNDSTGLGLAISKKIIDLHNGKIWAEVNDEITTFRFCLSIKS